MTDVASTQYPLPVLPAAEIADHTKGFGPHGPTLVLGSIVDMAGVARAKAVPASRTAAFHHCGMAAAPSWNVFCIDNALALTPALGVVGDMRLRLDLTALKELDSEIAWAPAEMFDQFGEPIDGCARGQLRKVVVEAERDGISALVGIELEFFVFDDADSTSADGWQGYGVRPFFERQQMLVALTRALTAVGLPPEQIHTEYGVGQYEVSFAPADPLGAADTAVLARLVIGRVTREHGLRVSFSPLPTEGDIGNGAHLHMSFQREGQPMLSGGTEVHGLTKDGAAALAGIVSAVPELLTVFAGSVLSTHRLQPGQWSGAHVCWGLDNKEAVVRLCAATPANPHGANLELKCVDPSANPYLAVAAMLGAARHGIASESPLAPEVDHDPSDLPEVATLGSTQAQNLERFAESQLARQLLGDAVVESTLAVRRHENAVFDGQDLSRVVESLRYSWSW